MCNHAFQLPAILNCDGVFAEMVNATYAIYERDFVHSRLLRDGLPVHRDTRILPDGDGKEEAFWHMIQREDKNCGARVPDFCRASRIAWTRSIIIAAPCPEIIAFDYDTGGAGQGGIKTYLWLHQHDFVVILKKQPRKFFLATSFCITEDWLRRDLAKKRGRRV